MKKVFFILFLGIPCLIFGQGTITISHKSTTPAGAVLTPPSSYAFQNYVTSMQVGKPASNIATRGRGYLEFDLNSKLTSNIANKISLKADLVFSRASNINNDTIKVNLFNRIGNYPWLNANPGPAYSELNSNIDYLDTIVFKKNASNRSKNIDKKWISFFYQDNPSSSIPGILPLSLVHKDENNNGITITKAELVITYWDTPSAPKFLQATPQLTSCAVAWTAGSSGAAAATIYYVYYKEPSSSSWKQITSSTTSAIIPNLTHSTLYEWRVTAGNPEGTSGYSNTETFTTLKPPPVISGSSPICYGSSYSFSATNWVQGTYTWDKSANLIWGTKNVVGNSSIDVKAASSSNRGPGWVRVMSGTTIKAEYPVWVGSPGFASLQVEFPYSGSYPNYWLISTMSYSAVLLANSTTNQGITSTNWTVTDNAGTFTIKNLTDATLKTAKIAIGKPNIDSYIQAKVYNACGYDEPWAHITVSLYPPPPPMSPPLIYPNPVSDILTIEIDEEAFAQEKANQQSNANVVPVKIENTYDIRLYDGQGNLLRQTSTKGSTVQFNVSALPNGVYYLHIYDGVNNTPEIQQIMVEH